MNIAFFIKGLNSYTAHVKPFIDELDCTKNNLYIIHINKYYGNTPKKNIANSRKITFIDLSENESPFHIFEKYNIELLVLFNPGHLYEQLLLFICKDLKIMTIYFQHGISPDSTKVGEKRKVKIVNDKRQIIKKYIFFYSSFIFRTLKSDNKYVMFKYLIKRTFEIMKFDANRVIRNYGTKLNHCNHAFVYGLEDKKTLTEKVGFKENEVSITGYPFNEPTGLYVKKENEKIALYISSALRISGAVNISIEQEKDLYMKLADQVTIAGFRLLIKLHPNDDEKLIKKVLINKKNIDIFKDKNLADLVISSDVTLGDFSSALFYPIKYYKPIIIINYGYIDKYVFEYVDFGIGIKIHINEIYKILKENKYQSQVNKKAYEIFLKKYYYMPNTSPYKIFRDKFVA